LRSISFIAFQGNRPISCLDSYGGDTVALVGKNPKDTTLSALQLIKQGLNHNIAIESIREYILQWSCRILIW